VQEGKKQNLVKRMDDDLLDCFGAFAAGIPDYEAEEELGPALSSDFGPGLGGPPTKSNIPATYELLHKLLEAGEKKAPLELYRTRAEDFWLDKKYSVKTTENPLLFEIPETAKRNLETYKEADPSTKTSGWHMKDLAWKEKFWNAAYQLRTALLSGKIGDKPITIRNVLESAGQWRQWVLLEKDLTENFGLGVWDTIASPNDYHEFGVFQDDHAARKGLIGPSDVDVKTPITGRYSRLKLGEKTVEDIYSLSKEELVEFLQRSPGELSPVQSNPVFSVEQVFATEESIEVKLNDKDVNMVSIVYETSGKRSWNVQNTFYLPEMEQKMNTILNGIIEEAQNPNIPDSEFHKMVGTMHWFMANTSPYLRGSASIADLLTATSYMMRGLRWPGWAQGVSADVTALSTANLKTFQNIFSSLMDGELAKLPI
jgi:hypothetical protein